MQDARLASLSKLDINKVYLIASRIPPGRENGIDGSRVRRVDGSIGRWVDGPKGGLLSVAPVREVLGEARGRFGGLAASLASPGGSLAVPGRSLASSRGIPGRPREGPWDGLGRFWGRLGRTGAKKVARFDVNHGFGPKKAAKWEPQGSHFLRKNQYEIALNF